MGKNSKFMTKINRLPPGTTLQKIGFGKPGRIIWKGCIPIHRSDENSIQVRDPDLGTVVENLLILKRRKDNEKRTD